MPIYQLKCNNCGDQFEDFYWINEQLPIKCSKCGQDSLIKLISNPADWYPHSCIFTGRWPEVDKNTNIEAAKQIAAEDYHRNQKIKEYTK